MPKLIFFGNERLATATVTLAATLKTLIAAGYSIEAIITGHADVVSRQKRDLEIGSIAHAHKIPVLLLEKEDNLADKLKGHQAEAAILVAFGRIIPQSIINLFPKGIINIHPSLLPKLRGPTPIETAILDGLTATGVSLMKLEAKMDAGPIYAQEKVALSQRETKVELANKLNKLGAELLVANLEAILDGSASAKAQIGSEATYTKLISKEDGVVDWQKPAEQIEREVRAYAGWPKSQAIILGHKIIVTKARIAESQNDGALVLKCNPGWLEILELKAPSGKIVLGREFIRGYSKPD